MGDHTETLQIDYDPSIISYNEILQVFWDNHNPAARSWSRQYMAIVFFHDEDQEKAAKHSKKIVEQALGTQVYTEIQPYTNFYLAEDYHQKYYLQNMPRLAREIKAYYPDISDLTNSTLAARLNGIAGGYGDASLLEQELDSYGLTPQGQDIIKEIVY